MVDAEAQRIQLAVEATESDISLFIHDPSPAVIAAVLDNRNLTEEQVLILAGRKNLPPDILESIAKNKRWAESYPIRLVLAKNPKTPLFAALSIARFLRLFDLAEIARSHALPVVYRRKIETLVTEKIPTLPLGVKKTLAKTAAGDILLFLIKDGYPEVVKNCLDNPHLVEAGLYKIISRRTTTAGIIRAIADHKNWTCRPHIKFALIRNEHTPLVRSVQFLTDLRLGDLRELYRDPTLPRSVKPYLHQELLKRGIDPEQLGCKEDEEVIEVGEQALEESEREILRFEAEADKEQYSGMKSEDEVSGRVEFD